MLEFHQPTLADRDWATKCYRASGKLGCENTFTNLFIWGRRSKIARFGEFIIQRFERPHCVCYSYPNGSGDVRPALEAIFEDAKGFERLMCLLGMSKEQAEELDGLFPGMFKSRPSRNHFDYLYDIDRLADLKGKRLQSKRNHINRFLDAYPDWSVTPLTEAHFDACREFLNGWYEQHAEPGIEGHDYTDEAAAIRQAFAHYDELGMEGLVLYAEDKVLAFTMGNPINETVFDVNFEKADPYIQGGYAIINREFARWIRERHPQVKLLNREDDMGLEGLRKAKESYVPDLLLEKYIAELEVHIL